jgi:hypothetical protein
VSQHHVLCCRYSEASDAYAFAIAMCVRAHECSHCVSRHALALETGAYILLRYEMATLQQPWNGLSNLDAARAVIHGMRPGIPAELDPGYAALMQVNNMGGARVRAVPLCRRA